jgi:hypothetical protein
LWRWVGKNKEWEESAELDLLPTAASPASKISKNAISDESSSLSPPSMMSPNGTTTAIAFLEIFDAGEAAVDG